MFYAVVKRLLISILAVPCLLSCTKGDVGPEPGPDPVPPPGPDPEVIHVEAVQIVGETYVAVAGEAAVEVRVYPDNATDKTLRWAVDDETVATVIDDGTVVGHRKGRTRIKAESVDGGKVSYAYVSVDVCEMPLSPEMISTCNPMQFETWGWTPDGDWDVTKGNRAITDGQKKTRLEHYARPENLWDGDLSTCFHTNFDIYVTGYSWNIRKGATVAFNYIQVDFEKPMKVVDVEFTMSDCHWFWFSEGHGGFRIETSIDGTTYAALPKADNPDAVGLRQCKGLPGETILVKNLTASSMAPFRSFRIYSLHNTTYTWGAVEGEYQMCYTGQFGIAEMKINCIRY